MSDGKTKLSEAQKFALHCVAKDVAVHHRYLNGAPIKPQVYGSLVRRGLITSLTQSEHAPSVGERRYYYQIYRLTEAGRAALQEKDG